LIASTLRTAITGTKATVFREDDDEIDIVVKLDKAQSYDLNVLRTLTIPGDDGKRIPLAQVASIGTKGGLGALTRIDFKRVIYVYADISKKSGRTATAVIQEIQQNMKKTEFKLPTGYSYAFRGEQEDQQEAMDFLIKAFFVANALIFLILVSQFNSLVLPLIIIFSVLLSFIGVVWGLFVAPTLFQFKLKTSEFVIIMTGVGIVSLAGVVVNNAIVLLDYILLLRKEGYSKVDAIVQAGLVRFRPVMLTAVTTVLGLIPMSGGFSLDFTNRWMGVVPLLVTGAQSSEWWSPLANAVIFGLIVATMLTLVMVPVFYYIMEGLHLKLSFQPPNDQ